MRSRVRFKKSLLSFICLIIVYFGVRIFHTEPGSWRLDEFPVFQEFLRDGPQPSNVTHDKWIVVTTINEPTHALKLLRVLPGWKVVVIGDIQTSQDWNLEGVTYLDLKAQEKFNFAINSFLHYHTYARKMFGYLYAIQHGARYIYDIDDDNLPLNNQSSFIMEKESWQLMPVTNEYTFNVYPHFGQLSLWPRGFPMDHIQQNFSHHYIFCHMRTPPIQQGLADKEPDVDAVVRLMHSSPLNAYFDHSAPPLVLPRGSFAPFNSQNTMFSYSSFWALFLAVSPTSRVTDIIRSYWAQRLMMETGQFVSFLPASVLHERNPHKAIEDAELEKELLQMGNLISKIKGWQCSKMHFFACASDLAYFMAKNSYFAQEDLSLLDAWMSDLSSLGYISPALRDEVTNPCRSEKMNIYFYPEEQKTPLLIQNAYPGVHQIDKQIPKGLLAFLHESRPQDALVTELCNGMKNGGENTERINILVVSNEPATVAELRAHQLLYRKVFSAVIYCISINFDKKLQQELNNLRASHIVMKNPNKLRCLSIALKIQYNVSGVLWGPIKTIPSHRLLQKHNVNQIWSVNSGINVKSHCSQNMINCQEIPHAAIESTRQMIDRLTIGEKQRNRLKLCLKSVNSSSSYISNYPLHVPCRVGHLFSLLVDASGIDLFTQLLVELVIICNEFSSETFHLVPDGAEFYLGFDADKLIKGNDDNYQKFCKHFS